jgi:hypothetical protein
MHPTCNTDLIRNYVQILFWTYFHIVNVSNEIKWMAFLTIYGVCSVWALQQQISSPVNECQGLMNNVKPQRTYLENKCSPAQLKYCFPYLAQGNLTSCHFMLSFWRTMDGIPRAAFAIQYMLHFSPIVTNMITNSLISYGMSNVYDTYRTGN